MKSHEVSMKIVFELNTIYKCNFHVFAVLISQLHNGKFVESVYLTL